MTFIVPVLIALALSQMLIGLGILFQSRRSKQTYQTVFAVLLIVLFLWTLTTTALVYVDAYATPQNVGYFNFINSLSFLLGASTISLIYLFGLYYPVKKTGQIWRAVLWLGFVLIAISPFTFVSGSFKFDQGQLVYQNGGLSSLFILYTLIVLAMLLVNAVTLYKSAADKTLKRQATTLLIGLTLTLVHALLFIIVLPVVFGNNPLFYQIGYLAPYYYTGLTAYSLVRQGLFDIRAVILRAVVYTTSLLLVGLLIGTGVFFGSLLFVGDHITFAQILVFVIIGMVVALLYQPTVRLFNTVTRKLFYRDAYDSQLFIDELNKILVSTIQLDEMLKKTAALVTKNLRIEFCVFNLVDHNKSPIIVGTTYKNLANDLPLFSDFFFEHKEMFLLTDELTDQRAKRLKEVVASNKVSLVMPLVDLRHRTNIAGLILLGDKKSGASFNRQDLSVLSIAANELVIAIQNALRFKEIQSFNTTLEQKIDDATRELRRKNDRLRVLDQTKDDFISMASHQLRTPLTSVKGYVSMVLDGDAGKVNELQKKLLNQSFLSSQRMVYLISDLLNVSRLRTGKFVIEPVESNLADVIESEVEQLQETAKGRELKLTYHKPDAFPALMIDENKLRQVIMNFIDNAIYYTPAKGHIMVNLVDRPDAIEFTVVDDGIGVPKAEQHHLFSKFYRAHNAKRARPDGTGLGLFMAKKVIIAQGGAVIFKSQEGKGSTFGFTFPKRKLLTKDKIQSQEPKKG